MPVPTKSQIRTTLPDFQKSYLWRIAFLTYPSGVNIDATRFNLQCLSSDIPTKTNATATLMMRGHQIFDPGITTVEGTIELTFLETVDRLVTDFFTNWETAVQDKTSTFTGGNATTGGLTASISMFMMNNQQIESWEYGLLWAYPERTTFPRLDGGTSEPYQPSVTLRYTDYYSRRANNSQAANINNSVTGAAGQVAPNAGS